MPLEARHLIDLETLPLARATALLDLAEQFLDARGQVATPAAFHAALADRQVALLFLEPSTRTRVSFEIATRRLGGYPVVVDGDSSSIQKGESVVDTCRNLEAMGVSAFVVRHQQDDIPHLLTQALQVPVINAGNGRGEHPTQGLLDTLTLRRRFGRIAGLRVSIIGDIAHSRVARSNAHLLSRLGAHVTLGGPPALLPENDDGRWPDVRHVTQRAEALEGADAVIVLRIQHERLEGLKLDVDAYIRDWRIDDVVLRNEMRPSAVVLHPGPVMRGVELAPDVADGPRSLILAQVAHGVAIRQAVLATLVGASGEHP